jgi:hypothetical protein
VWIHFGELAASLFVNCTTVLRNVPDIGCSLVETRLFAQITAEPNRR